MMPQPTPRPMTRPTHWILILCYLGHGVILGTATENNSRQRDRVIDFERDIRPILRRHCYTCHGADTQEGGLRLDRRDRAFAGGDRGKVVIPRNIENSRLLRLVKGKGSNGRRMPPKDEGHPLSVAEIKLLEMWIDQGATWPESSTTLEQRGEAMQHWAFQSISRPSLPKVKNPNWCQNPIDHFILAQLETRQLTPATTASKRKLVRRIYLDTLGIPPTPAGVATFENDTAPDAWATLVDRLLSAPQMGERWGRHWLDLVRYADTNGYEGDGEKPFAWRYRDYVIDAINKDKPYNDFVREQVAGDEISGANVESVLATGFLRVGPWDAERGASVQPSEQIAERYNQLDDMVSTTSVVFLGITMGCARCHDHKFDPFSARDYYSLVSVFQPLKRPHKFRTELATPAAPPQWLEGKDAASFPQGYFFRELTPKPPETHLLIRGNPNQRGPLVTPAVPAALVEQQPAFLVPDKFTSRRRLSLAEWIVDETNPLAARVIVNRVWQSHFGHGLVRTPSDFGRRSSKPSHPQLLDWLAHWFMHEANWSLKNLHRLVMTSNTYQMGTSWNAIGAEQDVDNLLLWHFPYRRLEMEVIRDSMLAVSGQLNLEMHGPSMFPKVSADATRSGYNPGNVWKAFDERGASRRTIYAYLKRTFIPPMFDVLDFCDTARSVERRSVSTVAPQALTLLNGEFVNRQAYHFAQRLIREAGAAPENQITHAYQLALGRLPDKEELEATLNYLRVESQQFLAGEQSSPGEEPGADQSEPSEPRTVHNAQSWSLRQMCRVLFNLNEFVYSD
ncbi:MAG: PSD1 and planctomycete cytochrome C domain-containing protein [Planctomycetota bacterium]|nr:PSD1 and planctomycete cytochrome C domain-containing protein [Planctomycetota bacterium]